MKEMLDRLVSESLRDEFLRNAVPKVGESAAVEYVKVWEAQRAFSLSLLLPFLWAIGWAAGGGGSDLAVVLGVFGLLVLMSVPGVCFAVRQLHRHRYFREAGRWLGVKVDWLHPVPIGDSRYARWLDRHPEARTPGDR